MSADISANAIHIADHMTLAGKAGAKIVHFPETALSGYIGAHFNSLDGMDWGGLDAALQSICDLAKALGIWTVVGSTRQHPDRAPGNCIHVISDKGGIVGTYDKQRLYNDEQNHYSAGRTPLVIEIEGVKCGFLICYDSWYPELYAAYREAGVSLLFHSYYIAKSRGDASSLDDLALAQLITRGADNRMWTSASNSSEPYSRLASCIAAPDGSVVSTGRHEPGIVIANYSMEGLGWTFSG